MHGTDENIIDGEIITDMVVTKNQAQIAVRPSISPAEFKAEIENRRLLKSILLDYVRGDLQEGTHFYYASKFGKDNPLSIKPKDGEKPCLNKEGALNVCHTLRCFPGKTEYDIRRDADGHITVYADAQIFNTDSMMIATSRGSCSTRESKYAYRWVSENQVPADVDKSLLKSRGGKNNNGSSWKQFQLPNPDLADLENTVIKMADKRALKGAVDKLPIVSDIFAPPADDDNVPPVVDDAPAPKAVAEKPKAAAPVVPQSVERAVTVSTKLQKDYGVDFESLAMQFLPEGVAKFSDLSEEQALAALPAMVELLNTKVAEAKAAK